MADATKQTIIESGTEFLQRARKITAFLERIRQVAAEWSVARRACGGAAEGGHRFAPLSRYGQYYAEIVVEGRLL